jgi:hypothetical protein
MSSITRVLRAKTWNYFTGRLPNFFIRSPKTVKEVIMADINDSVQEFWRTPGDGAVRPSFFAMLRLFEILKKCYDNVCCDNISFFLDSS